MDSIESKRLLAGKVVKLRIQAAIRGSSRSTRRPTWRGDSRGVRGLGRAAPDRPGPGLAWSAWTPTPSAPPIAPTSGTRSPRCGAGRTRTRRSSSAREGTHAVRHRGQRVHRRRLLAVVQRPRPPPPGDRRGGARAARPRRAHDDARPLATRRRSSSAAATASTIAPPGLSRVFYSDNGSTAAEIALKMAFQYWQHSAATRAHQFVCLRRRLPRRHARVGLGRRHRPLPRAVPAAAVRAPMARAGRRRRPARGCSTSTASEIAAVIVEPLVQGAAGHARPPDGLPARGARAVRRARRAADLRRGGDRLRPHRHDVRLRAGGRGAGPHVPWPRA